MSYGPEGNVYSGLDSTLKSPTEAKIAALPGAGVAVVGAAAAPGACLLLSTELAFGLQTSNKPLISCALLLFTPTAAVSSPPGSVGSQRLLAHNQAAVLTTAVATPVTQVQLIRLQFNLQFHFQHFETMNGILAD